MTTSPVDPIALRTKDDVQYFSVRVQVDKVTQRETRNFVKIEESCIETDRNTVIICRTAVCFVDQCIKSVTNFANCQHIVQCQGSQGRKQSAAEVSLSHERFLKYFGHLSEPERSDLWDYYGTCASHAVQQLRGSLFVVKTMPCGNKENSGGLNAVQGAVTDYVHVDLGQVDGPWCSSCSSPCANNPCNHIILLYAALDGDVGLRTQFGGHLERACQQLDRQELDLFALENGLTLDWDSKAEALIEHMINEEMLLDEALELEFIDDLPISDFFPEQELEMRPPGVEEKMDQEMNLSVSFDTILTSIIERMNCNFTAGAEEAPQEFVFYVHNVSVGGGGGGCGGGR